jgi:hypothetical protein
MICHWPSLHLSSHGTKPQAQFCMKAKERKEVMTSVHTIADGSYGASGGRGGRVVLTSVGHHGPTEVR